MLSCLVKQQRAKKASGNCFSIWGKFFVEALNLEENEKDLGKANAHIEIHYQHFTQNLPVT